MRLADIRCRQCHKRYTDTEGCVTCLGAKKNLILPERDLPVLESVAAQLITVIEHEIAIVEKEQNSRVSIRSDPDRVKAITALSASMVRVLSEARQLQKQNMAKVQDMTLDEKAELVLEFAADLPPEHQRRLGERMVRILDAAGALDVTLPPLLTD